MVEAEAAPATGRAPAKVNLYLHVTGRRADGLHRLQSLVVFAGIADRLSAAPAADLSLALTGPEAASLKALPDNLVLRAARALAAAAGRSAGARLTLHKVLPVAAGLGGGSADAAAALTLLNRLWGLDLARSALLDLAARLGADVPVCLWGRVAQVSGIGEILAPAPALPPGWLVLANPRQPLPTASVFGAFAGPFSAPLPPLPLLADVPSLAAALRLRRNDLEPAAIALLPAVQSVLAALAAQPGCLLARMSGSGATCFGLFAGPAQANGAASRLAAAEPGWWVNATAIPA